MRSVVLLGLLAGCQQIFGLSEPSLVDARTADSSRPPIDAPPPFARCPVTDGFIACYDFNDVVEDTAGNQTTASGISFVAGLEGSALSLNQGSKVTIEDSTKLDTDRVTIEAWIYALTVPPTGTRMGVWDTDGQYALYIQADGALECAAGGIATSIAVIQPKTWTHV